MRDLIEARCGLRFDDSQRASLSASVAARMQQLGIVNEEEYYERLRGEASRIVEAELRSLLNLVTVTETCFFRDSSQFRLFREHIIPTLLAERSRGTKIRLWSAGCSSGEEAYSIAITLDDMGLYRAEATLTFEIIGTDLNSSVLEKARLGDYSARAVRNVEPRLLDRYFSMKGKNFQLNEQMRNRVAFEFGNLTQTPMPSTGQQDVIFCKNVAIYFRPDVTEKLVRGLRDTLAPGGYLLLGHAESLWQMSDGFEIVERDRAFCYRKAAGLQGSTFQGSAFPGSKLHRPKSQPRTAQSGTSQPGTSEPGTPEPGTHSADTSARYDLCLAAFRAGDWASAETGLTALISSCPTFVPAHLLLGGVYTHRARFDEAVVQAQSVLQLTDLEPRAHLLLGMIAARRRRIDDALQSLRRALYLDDSLVLAHFWLGNLYRDRGDFVRAYHEYENVVGDWERRTFTLTEEFASDLTAEQLVEFCRDSLKRLHV